MLYKIVADLIVIIHFGWILFMLAGFSLTVYSTFNVYIMRTPQDYCKRFFDKWIFRTIHLCGILFVAFLAILREYCPLTIWENTLRRNYNPQTQYPGSFLIHYIERFVYPNVHPLLILIPTVIVAVFTLVMFMIVPPAKIKAIFKKTI
jgi:hypothetical protein